MVDGAIESGFRVSKMDEKLFLLIVGQLMFNIFYGVHRGIVSIEPLGDPLLGPLPCH